MKEFDIDYKLMVLIFGIARALDNISTYLAVNHLIEEGKNIAEVAAVERNPIVSYLWTQIGNIPVGLILDFAIIVGIGALIIRFLVIRFLPDISAFFLVLSLSWLFFYFGFAHNLLEVKGYSFGPYAFVGLIVFLLFFALIFAPLVVKLLEERNIIR